MPKDKPRLPGEGFADDQEVVTFRYRGPDRRSKGPFDVSELLSTSEKLGDVTFDAKGNPVWQLKIEVPRRRKEDDTIDLIKCLDVDSLSLADEEQAREVVGYNPYGAKDDKS